MDKKQLLTLWVNNQAAVMSGVTPEKLVDALLDLVVSEDCDVQLKTFAASLKSEFEANKAALAKQKIDAEKEYTKQIDALDAFIAIAAPEQT